MAEIEPFLQVANHFMTHKGLSNAHPRRVERIEDAFLWYLDYALSDGHLVLEVSWAEEGGWDVFVWDFQPLR